MEFVFGIDLEKILVWIAELEWMELIWKPRLPSGRRSLYLIEGLVGVGLYEKAIGDRVGKLSGAA